MKNRFIAQLEEITLLDEEGHPYDNTGAEFQRRKSIAKRLGVASWEEAKPKRLQQAYILANESSFSPNGWEIEVTNGAVFLSEGPANAFSHVMRRELREARLARLEAILTHVGADNWRKKYTNKEILDGTQWELTVKTTEFNFSSNGSNSFPDGYSDVMNSVRSLLGTD